MKYKPIGHDLI